MNFTVQNLKKELPTAMQVWNKLNGVSVLFKPGGVHFKKSRETIIYRLCEDLNQMEVRRPVEHVVIEGNTNEKMEVSVYESFADHTLVVGPRYQQQDLKLSIVNPLGVDTSGVLVCGINSGAKLAHQLKLAKCTAFYRVKGILGQATDNYFKTGKIVEKSTYKHVRRAVIDKICSAMQSSHQRKMFELCGLDIRSQAAYELALKGPIRPANSNLPMIYTIKCIDFTPPEFTLEIICINERETYLKTLIHDLGIQLHSTATCTQLQCFQHGLFDVNLALLKKFWDLNNILKNMELCKGIIRKNKYLLKQQSPVLVENPEPEDCS